MTLHDPQVCMRQMRDHAKEVIELTRAKTRESFLEDITCARTPKRER
jgi:hypothetical protein